MIKTKMSVILSANIKAQGQILLKEHVKFLCPTFLYKTSSYLMVVLLNICHIESHS